MIWLALLLLSTAGTESDASKILLTSPQIGSHVLQQLSIGSELVKLGHEVYIALATRYPKPDLVKKEGIQIIHYQYPLDAFYPISEERERLMVSMIFDPNTDYLKNMREMQKSLFEGCEIMMSDRAFLDRLRKMNFDLVLVEPFIFCPCHLLLPHHLGVPFVSMMAAVFPWHVGIPALPSFYGLVTPKQLGGYPNLETLVGRLMNTAVYLFRDVITKASLWSNTTLLKQYGDGRANDWIDLLRQSELFITDRDHHLEEFFQPSLPHFISVPGLTTDHANPLPADLENLFNASGSNGVILLSFGASASYMPVDVIKKFFEAFSRLKQTVVAKFIVPDNVVVPPNVKLLAWLPQNDILGHPKTKLFITHCGSNGQHEALYHGVPMLGMPLYAEQNWNCERARRKGLGLDLDILDFTADQLYNAILQILPEKSTYHVAARQMSAILKSYPMNGRQTAAFWIEHVIKFGGKHLRPLSMDQPTYQFLMLDVLLVLLLVLIAFVFSCAFCFRLICRKCRGHHDTQVSDRSKKAQ